MSTTAIQTVPFAEVKENLSRFVSTVARRHAPRILERSHGEESILALPLSDLPAALAGCAFDARVTFGESVVATLPQFGLVASGPDLDSAIDALVDELTDYCADFFSDFDYYRHTERVRHLPWLLRFGLAEPADRRSLLTGTSGASVDEVATAAAR